MKFYEMIFFCFKIKPVRRKKQTKKITGVKIPTAASKHFLKMSLFLQS